MADSKAADPKSDSKSKSEKVTSKLGTILYWIVGAIIFSLVLWGVFLLIWWLKPDTKASKNAAQQTVVQPAKAPPHIVFIQRKDPFGESCVIVTSEAEKLGDKALENDKIEMSAPKRAELQVRVQAVEKKTDQLATTVAGHGQQLQRHEVALGNLQQADVALQAQVAKKMDKATMDSLYYALTRQKQTAAPPTQGGMTGRCGP